MADGKSYGYRPVDWGYWNLKSEISPAALNYPKTKILKMLKENYIPKDVKDIKTKTKRISSSPKKNPFDWNDFDDFFQK
jgi:hypothetical protein